MSETKIVLFGGEKDGHSQTLTVPECPGVFYAVSNIDDGLLTGLADDELLERTNELAVLAYTLRSTEPEPTEYGQRYCYDRAEKLDKVRGAH